MVIKVKGQRIHAYHGVLPQERKVGAWFTVSTEVEVQDAVFSDELSDTVSYADIARVAEEEMREASHLLEHVAHRIARRLLHDFPTLARATVEVIKQNPPMGVECEGAGVELTLHRNAPVLHF